jgi:hypothetical protein
MMFTGNHDMKEENEDGLECVCYGCNLFDVFYI